MWKYISNWQRKPKCIIKLSSLYTNCYEAQVFRSGWCLWRSGWCLCFKDKPNECDWWPLNPYTMNIIVSCAIVAITQDCGIQCALEKLHFNEMPIIHSDIFFIDVDQILRILSNVILIKLLILYPLTNKLVSINQISYQITWISAHPKISKVQRSRTTI